MKDDEDEEVSIMGASRYPCMPSRIALQQMRNRLQLAQLGKKLMKFTAQATMQELRRLSVEYENLIQDFENEMREAYILLARSRYYHPNLNNIVTENIAENAQVLVHSHVKHLPSVNVIISECIETEHPSYPHLGIGYGGETITETKKAWFELLIKLLHILQVKATFEMVEASYKASNKKVKALQKVVIPRIDATSRYIILELEELAREDFYRMKKTKNVKLRVSDEMNRKLATNINERETYIDSYNKISNETVLQEMPDRFPIDKQYSDVKISSTKSDMTKREPDNSDENVWDNSFDTKENIKIPVSEEMEIKRVTNIDEREPYIDSNNKISDEVLSPMSKESLDAKLAISKHNVTKIEPDDSSDKKESVKLKISDEKNQEREINIKEIETYVGSNRFCSLCEYDSDDDVMSSQIYETSNSYSRLTNLKQLLEKLISVIKYCETKDLQSVDVKTILRLSHEAITIMKVLIANETESEREIDGKAGKKKKISYIQMLSLLDPKNQSQLSSCVENCVKTYMPANTPSLSVDQSKSFQDPINITQSKYNLLRLDKYPLPYKISNEINDNLSIEQCPCISTTNSLDGSYFPDEEITKLKAEQQNSYGLPIQVPETDTVSKPEYNDCRDRKLS